ncbi:variant erythrocyte surface antigen-1 family protein [Babesia caballi]|uniref:Variant erythrocyte surface antigen-1 family protein n=1 Tax=Babesia caballi TaxID=5871 RepID=A0AAV4M084_BABCB|nr:variant erythrocyte surface antigen-1 family protein [Babesia caballi]
MTDPVQKNSFTDAPKNLKEAIDWILRVTGKDGDGGGQGNTAIEGLSKEVKNLLDKDAGEVASGVLEVMGGVIDGLVKNLNNADGKKKPRQGTFKVLQFYIQIFKGKLENVRDYGSSVSEKELGELKDWLTGGPSGPIAKLAEVLATFIGWQGGQVTSQGIGKNGNYTSAYKSISVDWKALGDSDRRKCALIFLGIAPILFLFLTYLYWQCEGNDGWFKDSLSKGELKTFMESDAMGFKGQLNDSKKNGSDIAGILESAFSKFKTAHTTAQNGDLNATSHPVFFELVSAKPAAGSYRAFLNALVMSAESPLEYPLSCCHRIASTIFTPNDTYTVQSTNPASPSFLSYSGPAALAGSAYGFNVGGLNTFLNALLV